MEKLGAEVYGWVEKGTTRTAAGADVGAESEVPVETVVSIKELPCKSYICIWVYFTLSPFQWICMFTWIYLFAHAVELIHLFLPSHFRSCNRTSCICLRSMALHIRCYGANHSHAVFKVSKWIFHPFSHSWWDGPRSATFEISWWIEGREHHDIKLWNRRRHWAK